MHGYSQLSCCMIYAAVNLSPPEMISVCPGQRVSLTCTLTQGSTLRWVIVPPGTMFDSTLFQRIISSTSDLRPLPIRANSSTINVSFSRRSTNPLISTLSTDSITTDFNGTEVVCEIATSSAVTVIHVIQCK